jgi:hypothetical protein
MPACKSEYVSNETAAKDVQYVCSHHSDKELRKAKILKTERTDKDAHFDEGGMLLVSQRRYQPQDHIQLLGLRINKNGDIRSIKAVFNPYDFCLLDCLSAVNRACPIHFVGYLKIKRGESRELSHSKTYTKEDFPDGSFAWVLQKPQKPQPSQRSLLPEPMQAFVAIRPSIGLASIKCAVCHSVTERFVRCERDLRWICPNCDTSKEVEDYTKRSTLLFDDPYDKMIVPALPEQDEKRVGTLTTYWKNIIERTKFTPKDLLDKGTVGEETRRKFVVKYPKFFRDAHQIYQAIMEGTGYEDKDTVGRWSRTMEKELNHICPTDVCPDDACLLDDSVDSIFTHAYYCADAETRKQVYQGGLFCIVTLDRPRIYRLADLGASRDVVAKAYVRLAKKTKREAVHDAQKKANRAGLGSRAIKQARIDRAEAIYQAFRNGKFRSVEPSTERGYPVAFPGTRYFVHKDGSKRLLRSTFKPWK